MVGEAGIEPTTPGLEGRCSIQLSYSPTVPIVTFAWLLWRGRVKELRRRRRSAGIGRRLTQPSEFHRRRRGSGRCPHRTARRRLNRPFGRLARRVGQPPVVGEIIAGLNPENHALAVEIASIPEQIRGYGHVKERHLGPAKRKWADLMAAYRTGRSAPSSIAAE